MLSDSSYERNGLNNSFRKPQSISIDPLVQLNAKYFFP